MLWQARFWLREGLFPRMFGIFCIPGSNRVISDNNKICNFSKATLKSSNHRYSSAREHSTLAFASFHKFHRLSFDRDCLKIWLLQLLGRQMGTRETW